MERKGTLKRVNHRIREDRNEGEMIAEERRINENYIMSYRIK